jgi:hypothetical protein
MSTNDNKPSLVITLLTVSHIQCTVTLNCTIRHSPLLESCHNSSSVVAHVVIASTVDLRMFLKQWPLQVLCEKTHFGSWYPFR